MNDLRPVGMEMISETEQSVKMISRILTLMIVIVAVGCTPTTLSGTGTPVGNRGTLFLEDFQTSETYHLHDVYWDGKKLVLTAERMECILVFRAPRLEGTLELETGVEPLDNPQQLNYPKGEETSKIKSATLEITSVTGHGPWEVDGSVIVNSEGHALSGELKARVEKRPN
jgi:hypothetical protein